MASCVNSDNQLQVRQFSPLRRSVQLILNFGRASGWQFGRFSWLLLIISLILAVSSPVRRAKRGRSFASLLMKLPEGYVNGVAPRKATAMGGFGQQMLESMGWQKGQGLGKESQGIVAPVEAAKKDDTVGLGGKRMWNWELDYAASAYETAMAKVRGDDATATSSSSSDSESDDEMETDDSVRSTSLQFAGVISSASAAELKLAKQLAKGNNLGRFGARAGKLARIQEQEAVLAAKMDPSKSTRQISGDAVAASTPSRRLGKTVVIESTEPVIERPPPALQPSSWWGHKAFLSSGWLRGLHEADRPTERQEFTASTQEDIYNRVKQNQRQGKAGMGKRRGKDAAADWVGSKVVFDDANARAGDSCDAQLPAAKQEAASGTPALRKPTALRIAKTLIRKSKRQRVKLRRLEATVAEQMPCSDRKAARKVTQCIESGRLSASSKWITLPS